MKQILLLILTTFFVANMQAQVEPRFESFNSGTNFTAITVDGHNRKIWAGTSQSGVFSIDTTGVSNGTDFIIFNGSDPVSGPSLDNIRIKSMAADKLGNVWIGHEGINFGATQGGMERINSGLGIKHYYSDSNFIGFGFHANHGLGTRRLRCVTVDKNDKVWVAQKYHDLLVTGPPTTNYYLTPGVFSYKSSNSVNFTTIGGWWNTSGNGVAPQPAELPYPAFTFNPAADETAQSRSMYSVSTDDNEVWIGMFGYIPKEDEGAYIPHRILRYDLQGNYIASGTAPYGGFSFADMQIPAGGVVNGICANNEKGTWVTTSFTGKGFAVYKNGTWQYMNPTNFSQVIPSSTKFNDNAIWKDKIGRVFMGTTNGLIIYNGYGPVDNPDSYKLYTNYEFGSNNPRNVYDVTMLSNNVTAGSADPNNSHRSWIATDTGIMKIFLPIEGMTLYHVKEDYTYGSTTVDTDENISLLASLKNTLTDGLAIDTETPSIAADGSNATVFRFYTSDPEGFYNTGNESYKIFVGYPSSVNEIFTADYIKQFGYFHLKALSSYPGNPASASELEYIEFNYEHPEYIDANDYYANENYTQNYSLYILDVTDNTNPVEVYKHPIKIAVPPVLIGHGVWSDMNSLAAIESYLLTNKFSDYSLLKAWRTDGSAAEKTFMQDAWVIPTYIKNLKEKAAANMFSAGKVNVVVHSRGGLYTRGYIEGINPNYYYKKDVNSLVTLNTPHFGSQGGNFAVDKRIIHYGETDLNTFIDNIIDLATIAATDGEIPVSTLGQLIAGISDAEKVNVYGGLHLLVENDDISGVVPPQDPQFISKLNSPAYLAKLNDTPIHTISTEFDPCNSSSVLCSNFNSVNGGVIALSPLFKGYLVLYNAFIFGTNTLPNSVNALTNYLYDGEKNDFIVPLTSMQGGLGGTRYNTHFGPSYNYPHINLEPLGTAVTEAEPVLDKVLELFRSNVNDESTAGFFTQTGIPPIKLRYHFLTNLTAARNSEPFISKILINRDPAIFDNITEGDVLNYNIYKEEVDRIMVTYESVNDANSFSYEVKDNLAFANAFSYTIPAGYSGELKITAYGFKDGVNGYVKSVVTLNVEVPTTVTLQSIYFEEETPIILSQDNYTYKVIGTYSDGIDREVTNESGLSFLIEDAFVTSQVNNSTIKGEAVGTTLYTASLGGFEDTILVKVIENPSLQQTILTSFYGVPSAGNTSVDIFWETLREYENATFVLETSYGTPDNFTEINQQAGNGTTETPAQFNYEDTTFGANTLIYYRIKLIDTSGNSTYSSTIEVNLSTLGVDGEELSSLNLELYPNPAKTNEVTLKLDSKFTDKNAKLELYSLQGKRLSVQTLNVIEGANSFKLKIGEGLTNGIYLVRVSTTNYIKTVKLVVED